MITPIFTQYTIDVENQIYNDIIPICNQSIYDVFPPESIMDAIRDIKSNQLGLFSNITDNVTTFLQESINDYRYRTR